MRMMMAVMAAAVLVASPALAADQDGVILNLVCQGKASKDERSSPTLFGGGPLLSAGRERRVDYEDSVYLRIDPDGSGRAKLPHKIQSKHIEDEAGWFPLIGVDRQSDKISGQIRLHSMYKPKFNLDRITGLLSINGQLGDFAGRCEPYNADEPTRKF